MALVKDCTLTVKEIQEGQPAEVSPPATVKPTCTTDLAESMSQFYKYKNFDNFRRLHEESQDPEDQEFKEMVNSKMRKYNMEQSEYLLSPERGFALLQSPYQVELLKNAEDCMSMSHSLEMDSFHTC